MPCLPGGRPLKFRQLWHPVAILLTFISMVILFIVVFYNAPLDHTHSTLEGKAGQRMWLLTVNQTGSSSLDILLRNFGNISEISSRNYGNVSVAVSSRNYGNVSVASRNHGNISISSRSEEVSSNNESSSTTTPLDQAARAVVTGVGVQSSGLHAYGFGIWGWCQWTTADWEGHAVCTKKPFYQVPKDADSTWDSMTDLAVDLPYSLTHLISGMSFLLVFLPFLTFSYWVILLLALGYKKPLPPWPVPARYKPGSGTSSSSSEGTSSRTGSDVWKEEGVDNYRTRCAWILRDWRTQLTFFCLWSGLTAWTLGSVLSARSSVRSVEGLTADVGYGFDALLGAWGCFLIAQILPMCKDTLIHSETPKGQKKDRSKSKG